MIALRDLMSKDENMIREWRNLPEVAKYMLTDHEITPEEHKKWFQQILEDSSNRYWVVTYHTEDVGLLGIDRIDYQTSHCYWHFYIAKTKYRGRGIGSYCEYAVLNYVFGDLRLNKICGEVLSFNEVILNIHWSFGFKKEGILRRHVKKNGQFCDLVLIGMLREEWESNRSAIEDRLRSKRIL